MEMANITMPVSPALQLVATRSSADGAVEVLQGANMTLSTVLQLETDESMHPWPVELDSPTYFELNLSLADGLTFAMPLPVHCTTAELVSRANPNEQVIQQDVSIFSASLAPRTRSGLGLKEGIGRIGGIVQASSTVDAPCGSNPGQAQPARLFCNDADMPGPVGGAHPLGHPGHSHLAASSWWPKMG